MNATKGNLSGTPGTSLVCSSGHDHGHTSATPGDYFWLPDDDGAFVCEECDEPMVEVRRTTGRYGSVIFEPVR